MAENLVKEEKPVPKPKPSAKQVLAEQEPIKKSAPVNASTGQVKEPESRTTSIHVLDRSLGGGLPSGSVVYIMADPKSMAEVFLYQITMARKTYYFSNERRPAYILQNIKSFGFGEENIEFVDIYSNYYLTAQGEMVDNVGNEFVDNKIVEFTENSLRKILTEDGDDVNIIFDSFSFYLNLNINPGSIKRLISIIYETTKKKNCLTLLYGLKDTHDKGLESEILKSVDVIFDIDLVKGPDRILNQLSVPKMRGKVQTTDVIKFRVENGIQIDTSRDIA